VRQEKLHRECYFPGKLPTEFYNHFFNPSEILEVICKIKHRKYIMNFVKNVYFKGDNNSTPPMANDIGIY